MARNEVQFSPDHAGLRQLARSDGIGEACLAAAREAKAYAESISPVATGQYRDSFVATRTDVTVPGRWGGRRAGAMLYNTAPHHQLVEFRNGSRVLQRTAAWAQGAFG